MNNMRDKPIFNKLFIVILVFFIILKIITLFVQSDLMWDSAVYMGMGKQIYSLGRVGLWEPSRPLVWPLIIGFFWKTGFNFILSAKILVILFSFGCAILVYIIAAKIFDNRVAFYTALFFIFSPTFFIFGGIPVSDVPSLFFLLLSIFYFIRKKDKLCGCFLGISFMTRFFQIFFIIPILIIYLSLWIRGKIRLKNITNFALFFMIPIMPYFLLNVYLYKNPFYPFVLQSFMTKNTGWIFYHPLNYYFINLFRENFLTLFSITGVFLIFRKSNFNKTSKILIFLIPFVLKRKCFICGWSRVLFIDARRTGESK